MAETDRYRTIVADPPWPSPFGKLGATHRVNPNGHYATMAVEDIAALPISDLAEERAHLWLWVMNSNVPEGWRVAAAWGFRVITMLTWCKPGPGVGHWFRTNTEHLLFCTRGDPMPRLDVPTSTWFIWPRGEHSAKPEAALDLVERVSSGPYLELFARRNRLGWDTWGNECHEHVRLET